MLRDLGFELGGNANNFRKRVQLPSSNEVQPLAREMLSILCNVLGYDGRSELSAQLHLGTLLTSAPVFKTLSAAQLKKILRGVGFVIQPNDEARPYLVYCRYGDLKAICHLSAETNDTSGDFELLLLRSFVMRDGPTTFEYANELNRTLNFITASVDVDGDLILSREVVLRGGRTARCLATEIRNWVSVCGEIVG